MPKKIFKLKKIKYKKKKTLIISIEKEITKSYLEYSINVILNRALPDIRDGLKPVHRRILYSMYELKNFWYKEYKKSARIVGDVIGKYHPHGDSSVYEAIVKMCQNFSSRYLLIEGQGNFGSIDGDSAAAMRYTEIRISRIGYELLDDIDKNTVKFEENYDGNEIQPIILPSKIPNLLINGCYGIAVGMSSSIPPHNLCEVIKASLYLLKNKNCKIQKLINIIKGPDFPTYGIIKKTEDINIAYKTGKGKVNIIAKIHIEELNEGENISIVITELPYLVGKNQFLEKLSNLINKKILEEILSTKDESNKIGIRLVIILKKNINLDGFLKKINEIKLLESAFYINMIAIVNKKPKLLNLKKILKYFLLHRKNVITNKCIYNLELYKKKYHDIKALIIALDNIEELIDIIKKSKNNNMAIDYIKNKSWNSESLNKILSKIETFKKTKISKLKFLKEKKFLKKENYKLSNKQIKNILNMKIQKLSSFEKINLLNKYNHTLKKMIKLIFILNSPKKINNLIKKELLIIKNTHFDKRRTKIY